MIFKTNFIAIPINTEIATFVLMRLSWKEIMKPYPPSSLISIASAPYRRADLFAYFKARFKLQVDPAFRVILARRLLNDSARVLDLGCGQGLLASWLRAAQISSNTSQWPTSIYGIERSAGDIHRAQRALLSDNAGGIKLTFKTCDLRTAELPDNDATVLLDVLHYLDYSAQEELLRRIKSALIKDGLLLTRIGDADGGLRFHFSTWFDKTVLFTRGDGFAPLYCRPLREWLSFFSSLHFKTEIIPMKKGTPFANVMLLSRAQ